MKKSFSISSIVILFLIFCSVVKCSSTNEIELKGNSYKIWCVGICDQDKSDVYTIPGTVLMGGGTDTIEAFEWQIKNAKGGDFVVLRASGDDAYNEWIYNISIAINARLNSVRTILFKNQKASFETEVLDILRNAEAVFFAGGDQSDYIKFWSNTEVQNILQEKVQNITIGGTSAGLAILGNWIYSAEKGSIESEEALANPYDRMITLVPAFLKIPYLDHVITDSHFVTRDRMGRMLTFVARILQDSIDSTTTTTTTLVVHGVGVDEHTALLLDHSTGLVQAVGVNTAYVCTNSHQPEICKKEVALTFKDIQCTRLSGFKNDLYSFTTFEADKNNTGIDYDNDIINGKFTGSPYGESYK